MLWTAFIEKQEQSMFPSFFKDVSEQQQNIFVSPTVQRDSRRRLSNEGSHGVLGARSPGESSIFSQNIEGLF